MREKFYILSKVGRSRQEPVGGEDGVKGAGKILYSIQCRKGPVGGEVSVTCLCIPWVNVMVTHFVMVHY